MENLQSLASQKKAAYSTFICQSYKNKKSSILNIIVIFKFYRSLKFIKRFDMKKFFLSLIASIMIFSSNVSARDYISIVGSSTVYPFATLVAEKLASEL